MMAGQICLILFPLLVIVGLSAVTKSLAFDGANDEAEDCLVLPYISSFDDFQARKLNIKDKNKIAYSVYLKFKVDYDYTVEISNLLLTGNRLTKVNSTRVKISPNEKDRAITYTTSSYRDLNDPKKTRQISYTKSDAFREARKIHNDLNLEKKLAKPNRVAPPCSPAYIYDSDFLEPTDLARNRYIQFKYHKFMSCHKIIQYDDTKTMRQKPSLISSHDGYSLDQGRFRNNEITAAAYSNSLVIYATANGAIYIEQITKEGRAQKLIESVSLTHKPADLTSNFIDPKVPIILRSQFCYQKLREINFAHPESMYDIVSSKPLRTITRAFAHDKGGAEILVAEARDLDSLHLHYTDPSDNRRKRTTWPLQGVFRQLGGQQRNKTDRFYISSMAIFQHKNITRCQLVFRRPFILNHLFYVNSELHSDYSIRGDIQRINSDLMAEPDDITYWSKCEKIISFYGFMYTMHHYNENIFRTESKWNILDDSLFDYPIEAVHADEDVFYFFTKSTTVYKMIVDDSFGCKELRFRRSSKTTIHVSEFFGYSLEQFHTEGRYFSSQRSGWQPKWDTYLGRNSAQGSGPNWPTTTEPLIERKSSDNSVWTYVGLGVLGLILLVVVVVMVYMVTQRVSSRTGLPTTEVSD